MKRLLALVVGAFGLRALLRRSRGGAAPVEELREKLAAHRSAEATAPEPAAPQEEPEAAGEVELDDVDARRADVHARARRKIDELSG